MPDVAVTIAAESQDGHVIGTGELRKAMSAVMHKNHQYITGNKETHRKVTELEHESLSKRVSPPVAYQRLLAFALRECDKTLF